MAEVLIIDDDKAVCRMLSKTVNRVGHSATSCHTLEDGTKRAYSRAFDVVFLDVALPDGDGLAVLREIRQTGSSPEVIIITGFGDPDGAEIAVREGAWDYLEKPLSPHDIILALKRILLYRDELEKLKKPPVALKLDGIVGNSAQMKACFDSLAHAANSEANVLITGETGTGKELFARAIHHNSSRAGGNFVVVDCAALPETLVESALFGYEKGAFTGAEKSQVGLIKQADGGTLFLDEVGELPLTIQKAFLRVLQGRWFRPIGGREEVESQFRLLSATNRNLDEMTKEGQFRKDLLYRLQSLSIALPPLRERAEDIRELASYHMTKLCKGYGIASKGYSPEFFDILASYDWPGNVRELFNTMEKILAEAQEEPTIFPKHLPSDIRVRVARASVKGNERTQTGTVQKEPSSISSEIPKYRDYKEVTVNEAEKIYFEKLMEITKGNIQAACQLSGLGRTRLYTLLKKHKISRLGWPSA